jgi:hypothetical protein
MTSNEVVPLTRVDPPRGTERALWLWQGKDRQERRRSNWLATRLTAVLRYRNRPDPHPRRSYTRSVQTGADATGERDE